MNEKSINIVSKYHQKENLANTLYLKQDEFDLSNPFEVANCVINLGYRKITENEVVISKEEYEVLINQNKGLKEENHILRLENNDLEAQVELKSNETAREIYHNLIELSENPCNDREEIYKAVFEPYGVEIGEDK